MDEATFRLLMVVAHFLLGAGLAAGLQAIAKAIEGRK